MSTIEKLTSNKKLLLAISIIGTIFLLPVVTYLVQLFLMLAITLFLGYLGFENPEQRANLLNLGIILFCIP